jgi:hypothetical protein
MAAADNRMVGTERGQAPDAGINGPSVVPLLSAAPPLQSADPLNPVDVASTADTSTGRVERDVCSADGLPPQGPGTGDGCRVSLGTLCNSRKKQLMWACCCCSTVIILVSFFLALYLPIMQLIRGTKFRLVHVDLEALCDNPMLVTLRVQVKNPAPVHIKVDKLEVHLMRTDSELILVDIAEPVALPNNVDSVSMVIKMRIKSLNDMKAAQALEDIRTRCVCVLRAQCSVICTLCRCDIFINSQQ